MEGEYAVNVSYTRVKSRSWGVYRDGKLLVGPFVDLERAFFARRGWHGAVVLCCLVEQPN